MKVKKFIITLVSFCVFSFILCFVWTLIFKGENPPLLDATVRKYKALMLLKVFLEIFPGVAATGFLVGMSLDLGSDEVDKDGRIIRRSSKRFSPVMLLRYKRVLLASLATVLVMSLCEEALKEEISDKLQFYKRLPNLVTEYKEFANDLYLAGQYSQSYEVAKKAYTLNKKDTQAKLLMDRAEGELTSVLSSNNVKINKNTASSSAKIGAGNANSANVAGGASGVSGGANGTNGASVANGLAGNTNEANIANSARGGSGINEANKANGDAGALSDEVKRLYPQYTFFELLEKSRTALKNQDYFNAHYWARLAEDLVGPRASGYAEAQSLVVEAWNALEKISVEQKNPNQELFSRKMAGYNALIQGDAVRAYYIFRTLSLEDKYTALDPDIKRFLAESERRMKKDFFFSDETLNMGHFENCNNVYFRLKSATVPGGFDIFYIKGVTTTREQNAPVQYLRGFCVIHIDGAGNYTTGEYYPYVKMSALDTSLMDEGLRESLKLAEGVRYIPHILLASADRNRPNTTTKGFLIHDGALKVQPASPNPIDNGLESDEVHMMLSMNYNDFELLKVASKGIDAMGISSLAGFTKIASAYGYSQSVYSQALLNHLLYPLFFLCALMGVAILAWHGRLDNPDHIFKFKWVSVLPIFCAIFVFVYTFAFSIYKLVNYNLFNRVVPPYSILAGAFFYIVLFVLLSIVFLSCHDRKPGDE